MTFPSADMALTHILVVSDLEASRDFYRDVLGAQVHRQYGGTSLVLKFLDNWLLLVTGGGPTPDKPSVTFVAPTDSDHVSRAWTIRVPDCQESYEVLSGRGAHFLTPPNNWGAETRAFFTDPDGNLIEISQATP